MNNNNDILSQLQAQQNAMQQQSSDIINNPVTTTPQAQPAGDVSAQDIGKALPAQGSTSTVAPVSQQQTPNWLEKLLPTAGGVLGSIGGALIPGLGEIGVGEAAGGAAGSAAGQALEDLLTGKQVGGDVGQAAIEGGIGGVGGKLLGAGIKGAGSALAGNAEKAIQQKIGAEEAANAVNSSTATKLNFGGISPKLQSDLKLGSNQNIVEQAGFDKTNPYDMKKVSQAGLDLNDIYNSALSKTAPVDMKGFGNTVYDTLQKTGTTDLTASPLGKAIAEFESGGASGTPRAITDVMNPTDVRSLQQAVGTQIGNVQRLVNNAELNGVTNTEAESQLGTLQSIYKDLGDKIKTPELNSAISEANVTPEMRTAFVQKYGDTLGNQLADTIDNAKTADDLLQPMQNYTQMNRASNMAIDDIENATGTPSAVQRAKFGVGQGVVTPQAVQNSPITQAMIASNNPHVSLAGRALNLVSGKGGGVSSEGAQKVGDTLQKFAPILGTAGAQLAATSPGMTGEAGANTAVGQGLIIPQQQNPGSVENLIQNINPAAKALGLDLLYAQHRMPGQETTGLTSADLQEANNINRVQSARSQLVNLINLLNQSGGAQGQVGGNLAKLGGFFTGGPAAQYDTQAKQLTDSINSILGTNIQAPSITMNQEAANSVLNQLQQALISSGA